MSDQKMRVSERLNFGYQTLRNITSPDDDLENRRVYCGNASARAYLDLPENENVREYLLTADGRKTSRTTEVHREIRETLKNRPNLFPILNSGITIVCRGITIDDKKKVASLIRPSIINGSQTRGELAHYLAHCEKVGVSPHDVHCKFELIVTTDDELIAEVSIARNFQNDVARLSIAGRLKQFEEIEASVQSKHPEVKLRAQETQFSDEFYDTEKLIQVMTALIPSTLWPKQKETSDPKKSYTYSGKSKCLRDFQALHKEVIGSKNDNVDENKKEPPQSKVELFEFFVQIAPTAYELYEKWRSHSGFTGTKLRAIERDKANNIKNIPDGIIFPILASLSAFVTKVDGKWAYSPPEGFTDADIIDAAANQYKTTAKSNPTTMGKTHSIYNSLLQITSIFKRFDPRSAK